MPLDWAAVSESIRLGTTGRPAEGLRLLIAHEASCESDRDRAAICARHSNVSSLLTLVQLLNCLPESLLTKRPFLFGALHHRLALVVTNGEVSAMFDQQRYSVIIKLRQ